MRPSFAPIASVVAALALVPALAAEPSTLATAKDLAWATVAEPAGALRAALWGDPKAGDNGMLLRWKFNSRQADLVRSQDVHIVVMAGTFTVEIDGLYKEFGPGGFISIPKGVRHTLGCEAAGECRFLVHHPGAVEITRAR